jgi:hypothetical protein
MRHQVPYPPFFRRFWNNVKKSCEIQELKILAPVQFLWMEIPHQGLECFTSEQVLPIKIVENVNGFLALADGRRIQIPRWSPVAGGVDSLEVSCDLMHTNKKDWSKSVTSGTGLSAAMFFYHSFSKHYGGLVIAFWVGSLLRLTEEPVIPWRWLSISQCVAAGFWSEYNYAGT